MKAAEMRAVALLASGAGGLLLVIGLGIGLWPRDNGQVQGSMFADTCGSAFFPNHAATMGLVPCSYYLDGPRAWAIGLCLVGLALLAFGLIVIADQRAKTPKPAAAGPRSIAQELESLAALHASGALSDEEFEAGKRRVLGTESGAAGAEPSL